MLDKMLMVLVVKSLKTIFLFPRMLFWLTFRRHSFRFTGRCLYMWTASCVAWSQQTVICFFCCCNVYTQSSWNNSELKVMCFVFSSSLSCCCPWRPRRTWIRPCWIWAALLELMGCSGSCWRLPKTTMLVPHNEHWTRIITTAAVIRVSNKFAGIILLKLCGI